MHSSYGKGNKWGNAIIEQINETEVPKNGLAMWHLGQVSMAVKDSSGKVCYFDPYFSYSYEERQGMPPGRNFASPLRPADITNADYVFISHQHEDHLDPVTLAAIAESSPQALFICPTPHIGMLRKKGIDDSRIIAASVNHKIELDGIQAACIAGKHEDYETDEQGNHFYLGYVLNLNGVVFYHAGDTIAFQELVDELKSYHIEIAVLPINGRDFKRFGTGLIGNMNFREAADLVDAIGADLAVPVHYDMFPGNTENPAYFVDYMHRHYPGQRFKLFVPGERMLYLSER